MSEKSLSFSSLARGLARVALSMTVLFAGPALGIAPQMAAAQSDTPITVIQPRGTVGSVIQAVEQQTGLHFFYNDRDVDLTAPMSVSVSRGSLTEVLEAFRSRGLNYEVKNDLIVLSRASQSSQADKVNVRGKVVDKDGEPIMSATIVVLGVEGKGAITDMDGHFSITGIPADATLRITYVGMVTQEVPLNGRTSLTITLREDSELLDEVVVVGYGSVKKKDVTTAISQISTEDINERPIVSAGQALQGKAAGVSVIQTNGAPGAALNIRVRGTTSMNGSNDPLYVVDGVPVDNLNFLAPTDIAEIQILKDASSAAIYGSRAANGVVLVITKSGQEGKPRITFNAQVGVTDVINKMNVLNVNQYKELQEEIGIVSLPEGLTDQTNWFDETYSTGLSQNYQLSVSNGTAKTKYYISGGYVRDKGVLPVAFFERINFKSSIDTELYNWLKVGADITYSDYKNNGVNTGNGANRGGVVLSVINTPTYAPIWDPQNKGRYYNNFYGVSDITNPLENLSRSKDNASRENRFIGSLNSLITLAKGLTFQTRLSLDRRNFLGTSFLDPIESAHGRDMRGEGSDNRNQNTVLTFDNIATYDTTISHDHRLNLMLGTSWTDSDYSNSWINASHYRNGSIKTLNVANKISWTGTGTGRSQWGIMSYFGRVQYGFQGKYLLTANVRADGSSKLHPNHRWGVFPSVSGAWRISDESFMSSSKSWLDDLKLRLSWGETGNQSGIGDYAYLQRYNVNRVEWFKEGQEHSYPTISQANLRTEDLTWETTSQTDIGLDMTAFDSRVSLHMDYYWKSTRNMLMYVSLPPGAAPANNIVRNEGEMLNHGWEVSLHTVNLKVPFTWEMDLNLSGNKNKLTSLELQKVYYEAKTSDFVNEMVVRNEPGRPLGGFYGYISNGVDPETGELIYSDLNNDGRISSSDKTYIGDPNPDLIFGMTHTFRYKGIGLTMFFQGSYGNDIFNASRIETEGMYDGKNQTDKVLRRWRIPGQITDVPKANFDLKNSSYFIEDGSYIRLKDITLSYDFDTELIQKIGLKQLRPFITGTNLLTLTKYSGMDPEVNQWGNSGSVQGVDWGTYPHSRSVVFGVTMEL